MTDSLTLQRSSSRKSLWVWGILGLLILGLIMVSAAPKSNPGGSSYGTSPGDYTQWYAFMQQRHPSIQHWQKPYTQMKGQGQTLIQVADVEVWANPNLSSADLLNWVKAGNTLIRLNWDGQVSGAPFRTALESVQGAVHIETTRRHELSSKDKQAAELKDAFGSVAWSYPEGKGRVILGVYPWLGANAYSQQDGNFRILEAWAVQQGGAIWFDEWIHGYRDTDADLTQERAREQSFWSYLGHQPIAVVAGQGILLFLLLLWGQNQRFGALTRMTAPNRNSSEQYIQALAETLNAHGHSEYVLTLLGQSFRRRLQTQLGMAATGSTLTALEDSAIAQRWSAVTGRAPQELLELLEQAQPQKPLSERSLLAWVQQAEAILRGLS